MGIHPGFINSIHYFRSIAIIFIVAGHCYGSVGWNDTILGRMIGNLVIGGTSLFVFISGFLFHHVFYSRFGYRIFISGKIKNVLQPYLLMSIFPVIYRIHLESSAPADMWSADLLLSRAAWYFLTGFSTMIGYWFVPFIMIIFLLSPLFITFIRIGSASKVIVLTIGFLISIFIHRSIHDGQVIHSLIYFMPIYLLGITASMHRQEIRAALAGKELHLIGLVVGLAALQGLTADNVGNYHKEFFAYGGADLMLPQKVIMCLLLMILLTRVENSDLPVLRSLASASFAIYFLHSYVIEFADFMNIEALGAKWDSVKTLLWIAYTACTLFTSYLIAKTIRHFLPSHSKHIIGW